MIYINRFWLSLFIPFCCLPALAQSPAIPFNKETGKPLIRHYSPLEYHSAAQNLALVQDNRGILYVGNNTELLEYDGVNWRHIEIPNQVGAWGLACDAKGQIFVGSVGDFGCLAPNSIGSLRFQSFLASVKPEDRKFSVVYGVHATPQGIYYQANERIFLWQNERLKTWKAKTAFLASFWINATLFVYQQGIGLMQIKGDSLQMAPGGGQLANRRVFAMLPFPAGKNVLPETSLILVGLNREGLFLYDGASFQPFTGEANDFLQRNNLRRVSALLNDSTFAIASFDKGAVIFNTRGEIIQILDQKNGLANDVVNFIITDREEGIWLGLLYGIDRVNSIHPAFTVFDERAGISGFVEPSIIRHNGILYARTSSGAYYLDSRQGRFSPVAGLEGTEWTFFKFDESLFALRETLRKVEGHTSMQVKRMKQKAWVLKRSDYDSNRVFICTQNNGFKILRREKDGLPASREAGWTEGSGIPGIYSVVEALAEESNGLLWLQMQDGGLIRLDLSAGLENLAIQRFGTGQGLPKGRISAFETSLYPVFLTTKGIYRFDEASQRFTPDSTFGALLANGSRSLQCLAEDARGNIWMGVREGLVHYLNVSRRQQNGKFFHDRVPFLRFPADEIWTIFPEINPATPREESRGDQPGTIIWFGSGNTIIRYDDNARKDYGVDYPALVRRVITTGDSVIYGGTWGETFERFQTFQRLEYANNSLRFQFAAASLEDPAANRYQVFLEGFDESWSAWMNETQKDYTNLPEGSYTFRVRAKNIYEHLSSEGSFSFTILPPWYHSWWAYFLYGFLFIGFFGLVVYGYNKRRTGQLKRRTKELETVVAERIAELAEKNIELQEMNTLKSRFFANISHEFRTPLTLILGQIESLLPDLKKEHNISRARMALRNGRQLQRLINQLLDLSKFDAREMTLCAAEQNIVPLLRHLTGSFESLAEQRKITLKFESSEEYIPVYFEQDKMEKIMHNLLSNALKFIPAGREGSVLVKVEKDIPSGPPSKGETGSTPPFEGTSPPPPLRRGETGGMLPGDVKIIVRDSGNGIPKDRLPHIFNRFFQVDSSTTREYEGTGIGLALTKELVQIHGGGISVESSEGISTTFTVRLPLGNAHLRPEQIADSSISDFGMRISDFSIEDGSTSFATDIEIQPAPMENADLKDQNQSEIPNPKSQIILIVEDNPDMRAYIRETLAGEYRILEAGNGAEGFAIAREEIPDLIITDVMMPRIDGYELTRKLRQDQATSHIPIIMLTAKAAESDKFEGLETGVDAFLVKPFSTKELQIRVRKLIELRQQLMAQIRQKPIIKASEVMVSPFEQHFLEKLQQVVEANIQDEGFQVEKLSREIGMSRRQLQRKLNALLDCSPAYYIRRIRLERAKQLLEKKAGNVTEIAFEVGYGNVSAFARAFREAFQKSPSEILNQQ